LYSAEHVSIGYSFNLGLHFSKSTRQSSSGRIGIKGSIFLCSWFNRFSWFESSWTSWSNFWIASIRV